jgi:cyanophycinase
MIPKGKLLIIGGHEDKGAISGENLTIHKKKVAQSRFEILGSLISKIPRTHHIIELIASASSIPLEMEEMYINSFQQEGFTKVGIIKVENKKDGLNKTSISRIKEAHAVFFTGGDQEKLVTLLGQSDLLVEIKRKYYSDKNFIIGGTSAGAMALPEIIIKDGIIREALYNDDIHISTGLGLIKQIIVDTHFIKRGRFARLAHAIALNPTSLGIGLEENTALLISEGRHATCIGTGMVILIDGSEIHSSNINEVDNATPIVMDNLKVSILAEGSCFTLKKEEPE